MDTKIIEKIQKLLALATSSNEHEAKLAAERANELLIKHNLSMQQIEGHIANYSEDTIETLGRNSTENKFISNIIAKYFFVEVVFHRSRITKTTSIKFFGEETNLEVAKYVYRFLHDQFEYLWLAYRCATGAETSSKQSYYLGLYKGLSEQLQARRSTIEQSKGLVLVRDPKLDEYSKGMRQTNTKINHRDTQAASAGMEHGKALRIARPIESQSSQSGRYLK